MGLTEGELMERLFSYMTCMRPFSKISKEMTPSHRMDLLFDGLFYYGSRKDENLGIKTFENVSFNNQDISVCCNKLSIEILIDLFELIIIPLQTQH